MRKLMAAIYSEPDRADRAVRVDPGCRLWSHSLLIRWQVISPPEGAECAPKKAFIRR